MNPEYQTGSLLDSLLAHGIVFHRSQLDPAEISICCPFCYEKRFRLGVNIEKDVAHCFNCEWRSRQAIKDLADAMDLGVLVTKGGADAQTKGGEETGLGADRPSLPDDFTLLVDRPKDNLGRKAYNYLIGRRVTAYQIRDKRIGASFCGRYAYRVVFPVYYGKKLQGLVTRDFTGQQDPKYLNSPGMKAVYNSPVEKKNKAVLVEGVFDCLALERILPIINNYDVLALLGHDLTDSQEERLEEYRDIILWPDSDMAGLKFLDVGRQLALRHRIFIVPPCESAKDAGEMTASELGYAWATRTRLTESLELRLRAEVAFRE